MKFRLVTPERVLFDEEAVSLSLPTESGEITVLPGHVELSALLKTGIGHFTRPDGEEMDVALSQGFIHIDGKNTITVLADTAEKGEELDLSVIEIARKRAEEVMRGTTRQDDQAFALAAAALERELARFKLATKRRKHLPK